MAHTNYMMPSETHNVTVITTQPGAGAYPPKRAWDSGLFGCCEDVKSCALSFCCPFIQEVLIAYEFDDNFFSACCFAFCMPASLLSLRIYMRGKENIAGDFFTDFVITTSCCNCYCCALAQLAREVKYAKSIRGSLK